MRTRDQPQLCVPVSGLTLPSLPLLWLFTEGCRCIHEGCGRVMVPEEKLCTQQVVCGPSIAAARLSQGLIPTERAPNQL